MAPHDIQFEWDEDKNKENIKKHGVFFEEAKQAFDDPNHIISKDTVHSNLTENRYYCTGKICDNIGTVRFTYRAHKIRIFGAAYWRKYRKLYEKRI